MNHYHGKRIKRIELLEPERIRQARLVLRRGRKVLVAPAGAPKMTTAAIKAALADFP